MKTNHSTGLDSFNESFVLYAHSVYGLYTFVPKESSAQKAQKA